MRKLGTALGLVACAFCMLTGCGVTGERTASLAVVYSVATVLALLLLIGYCALVKQKETWFLLLFAAVFVVNSGYLTLALSQSLDEALLANRIAYLGSVFLPLSIMMTVLNITRVRYPKWLPGVLLGLGALMFLVAASPGYMDIYYKEVSFEMVDGIARLEKVYGPWHSLYLLYLLGYFAAMVVMVARAMAKKKMELVSHAVILVTAVFINTGIWFIEQLVKIDFEVLSVSYIISEVFLLGLHLMMKEHERLQQVLREQAALQVAEFSPAAPADGKPGSTVEAASAQAANEVLPKGEPQPEEAEASAKSAGEDEEKVALAAQIEHFKEGLACLTPTERAVYGAYLAGKTTKEILAELNIKENTLKFHNKNLYGKLGVSSRRQLLEMHKQTETGDKLQAE